MPNMEESVQSVSDDKVGDISDIAIDVDASAHLIDSVEENTVIYAAPPFESEERDERNHSKVDKTSEDEGDSKVDESSEDSFVAYHEHDDPSRFDDDEFKGVSEGGDFQVDESSDDSFVPYDASEDKSRFDDDDSFHDELNDDDSDDDDNCSDDNDDENEDDFSDDEDVSESSDDEDVSESSDNEDEDKLKVELEEKHELRMNEVNRKWSMFYLSEEVNEPLQDKTPSRKKSKKAVWFSMRKNICIPMLNAVEWAEDYVTARVGPWLKLAADRLIFEERIHKVQKTIGWVFESSHRVEIWKVLERKEKEVALVDDKSPAATESHVEESLNDGGDFIIDNSTEKSKNAVGGDNGGDFKVDESNEDSFVAYDERDDPSRFDDDDVKSNDLPNDDKGSDEQNDSKVDESSDDSFVAYDASEDKSRFDDSNKCKDDPNDNTECTDNRSDSDLGDSSGDSFVAYDERNDPSRFDGYDVKSDDWQNDEDDSNEKDDSKDFEPNEDESDDDKNDSKCSNQADADSEDDDFNEDDNSSDDDDVNESGDDDEDEHLEQALRMIEVNHKWKMFYGGSHEVNESPCDETSHRNKSKKKSVWFSRTKNIFIPTLNAVEWEEDYLTVRVGPWLKFATERQRFEERVQKLQKTIGWVFESSHRVEIWNILECKETEVVDDLSAAPTDFDLDASKNGQRNLITNDAADESTWAVVGDNGGDSKVDESSDDSFVAYDERDDPSRFVDDDVKGSDEEDYSKGDKTSRVGGVDESSDDSFVAYDASEDKSRFDDADKWNDNTNDNDDESSDKDDDDCKANDELW